jgi:2-phospho-L-lactate guanylyltransferase
MKPMRAVLIPMKELASAKMRLAGVLDARQRAALAVAMLTDVVTACKETACFDEIAVISNDSEVYWHARELGARALAEPKMLTGLNNSLTFGQRYLARRVAVDELLILPADIPLARAGDIRAVIDALAAGDPPRMVLVRARDGGTNALALCPPESVAMHFGPQSADAHTAAAQAAGVAVAKLALDRLAFDVDSPEDLEELRAHAPGAATAAWLGAHANRVA